MGIFVVTVGLSNIALKSMYSKVHFAQSDSFSTALNPVKANISFISISLVVTNKFRTLDEHASGTTCGIEDTPMKGLEDFDNEFNEGGRSEELTTALSFAHSEITKKVLINLSKSIAFNVHRNLFHDTKEFKERILFKAIVSLGQDSINLRVFLFYCLHSVSDSLPNVFALR